LKTFALKKNSSFKYCFPISSPISISVVIVSWPASLWICVMALCGFTFSSVYCQYKGFWLQNNAANSIEPCQNAWTVQAGPAIYW
jgi:hypothetical protein